MLGPERVIFIDFRGFLGVWGQKVWHPLATCGNLWQPVAADWMPLKEEYGDPGS